MKVFQQLESNKIANLTQQIFITENDKKPKDIELNQVLLKFDKEI